MKLFLSIFIFTCISGCFKPGAGEDNENLLMDKTWELEYQGTSISIRYPVFEDSSFKLFFSQETMIVTGNIECNTFTSTYISNDSEISITEIAPTEINCPNSDGEDYEDQVLIIIDALSSLNSYAIFGKTQLTLFSENGTQLFYKLSAE